MPGKIYWIRRLKFNLILLLCAILIVFLVCKMTPPDLRHRLSMGTAYASMAFLAFALGLGPWKVLRGKLNPISSDRRRDIGIWSGTLAIAHTVIWLTVHLRGRMWMYFFKQLQPLALQNTLFGFANFVGLGAALLFVMLLAISNDFSLRNLGTRGWKSLQRWTYVAMGLSVVHGVAYQVIEERHLAWIELFAALVIATVAIQLAGLKRFRYVEEEGRK
jgi:sulfoxide reductase heme-binding subunit YedZ